ncbi:AraC-like DNA-binding protein [Neorhizobium galegae]|uniref:AraC family transcriptional regulator n=1 Tax=Neorhizobium galegae TaxID=399 RepID=UPI001AE720A6|nr:AraC family transcriptional regulator [Neorhizobium galegae]MBP2551813.1 AraC-like DNA-binding protein [Neorhizobium galegae]
MDPLSEAFALLDIRAARCTRFEAGGTWAFRFPSKAALKFAAVLRGRCHVDFENGSRHELAAGDAFLMAHAPGYVLANDEGVPPADGIAQFDWGHSDTAHHQGDDTVIIAGSFSFEPSDAGLLLDKLPTFLLICSSSPQAPAIASTLHLMAGEIGSTEIGASVFTGRLADMLLVQVLRAAHDQHSNDDLGWVGALCDARIGQAIRLMHGDPKSNWSIDQLASCAGMSRSAFTKRFSLLVGYPPRDYLLRWRLRLARDMLKRGFTVASAANAVGYSSESAFGNAFKRVYGLSPRRYGAPRHNVLPSGSKPL